MTGFGGEARLEGFCVVLKKPSDDTVVSLISLLH